MENTMKKCAYFCAVILLATLVIAAVPTEAEARIYEDTVRLHILAASDSEEDQALKLKIRDKLLVKYGAMLGAAQSTDDATLVINENISDIERDINLWICELGYSYEAKAKLEVEWFDTRVYESYTLPKGYYNSLIITIGKGEGKNWWCVMYPPLCLDIATSESSGYTDEEEALISNSGYRVKFKILELVSGLMK